MWQNGKWTAAKASVNLLQMYLHANATNILMLLGMWPQAKKSRPPCFWAHASWYRSTGPADGGEVAEVDALHLPLPLPTHLQPPTDVIWLLMAPGLWLAGSSLFVSSNDTTTWGLVWGTFICLFWFQLHGERIFEVNFKWKKKDNKVVTKVKYRERCSYSSRYICTNTLTHSDMVSKQTTRGRLSYDKGPSDHRLQNTASGAASWTLQVGAIMRFN